MLKIVGGSIDLSTVLNIVPDATVAVNERGIICLANDLVSRVFGYAPSELVGSPLHLLIPDRFRSRHEAHLKGFFHQPHTRPMGVGLDLFGLHKDGSEIPVEISLSPISTPDAVMAVAAIRDISDRKKIERELQQHSQELERSNKDLQQFAHVVAHELRQPLTILNGYCAMIKRSNGEFRQAKETADNLLTTTANMAELIADLLDLAKVGNDAKHRENLASAAIVKDALILLQPQLSAAAAEVSCGELPIVFAHKTQLTMVVKNLIENGIKYCRERTPRIRIEAVEEQDSWRFSVADNGIGISPEHIEKLFTMFTRLHPREFPGTGVGLALVKRVIEAHNGTIWVESTPGVGSTFFFSLPKATAS